MQRFLKGTIFALVVMTTAGAASASEVAATSSMTPSNNEIKPFNLVHRAYSGHFSAAGIPGFQTLTTAYHNGQIEAEDLVKTAINQGRLSPDTLMDQGYINAVEFQLQELEQDRRNRSR
jgi:hypothetical protein